MTLTGHIVGVKGNTGRGIAAITENNNYTITITLTDGTTYTTEPIAGYTNIAFDADYNLVVTKTDGTTETVSTPLKTYITTAKGYKDNAETAATNAGNSETSALGYANTATAKATLAESYAKGGTSSRTGEDTDNADYYRQQASTSATNASNSASSANTDALKSEGYAVGKQNGTDVSGGTYYQNNAKYYASQAGSSQSSASSSATAAATSEDESEAWAVGQINGADVDNTHTQYHNNSKYYSTQASSSASSASSSASTATTQALKAEGYAVGAQNGTDVSSGTYYQNNAKYYATEAENSATAAAASAASLTVDAALDDVSTNPVQNKVIKEALDTKTTMDDVSALLPTCTASGSIASFSDGSNLMSAVSVVADIDAVQDTSGGDPSPNNVCPITGWSAVNVTRTGKNLVDASVITALGCTEESDGSFGVSNLNNIVGQTLWTNTKGYTGQFAVTFIKKSEASNVGMRVVINYTDGTSTKVGASTDTSSYATYTAVSSSSKTVSTITGDYGSNNYTTYFYLQVEIGTSATDYEEPQLTTYTTSLGSTYYGGTLDVVSGVLTVTHGVVDLTQGMSGGSLSGNYVYFKQLTDTPKAVPDSSIAPVIAEAYSAIRFNGVASIVGTVAIRGSNSYIYVNTGGQSIPPTGKAVYELATPTTVQLTGQEVATLLGDNNVWADCGNISVTYKADIKKYVDNAIGTKEDDMIANEAITSGSVFSVNDQLYIATTTIAVGETIEVGVNCTETSIVEQVNALYALI